MNYTYILKCKDDSLYTGWTNDLKKRITSHNAGKGAKYTKARRPVELVYYEEFQTREEAMKRKPQTRVDLTRKTKKAHKHKACTPFSFYDLVFGIC